MKKTAEEIFDKVTKEKMLRWDIKHFKRTHPRLIASIIEAMEEYANQPKWISVEDKLPENKNSCLVYIVGNLIYPHQTTAIHLGNNHWSISGIQHDSNRVTHWQDLPTNPLPEKPI